MPVVIIVVASVVAFVVMGMASIPWQVHRAMTIEKTSQWGHGTRSEFWREFDSHAWEPVDDAFADSWFERSTESKIHASIVAFDGKGMVLGPLDFAIVSWRLRRMRPNRKRVPTVNWKASRDAREDPASSVRHARSINAHGGTCGAILSGPVWYHFAREDLNPMMHLKLEAIKKSMLAEENPEARWTLLLRGIARRIKDDIKAHNTQDLVTFAESLDKETPAIYKEFRAEPQVKEKSHGATT